MHWYVGSVAEAVALSKQRNAVFVVFIEGENDLSVEMAATIDHTEVAKRLSNVENFLAIKLKSGSANYTHFAQIYQFVPVPSLFFIGRNGTPLDVVCAGVQPDNLAMRIDRILEEHLKEKNSVGGDIKQQTTQLLQAEGTPKFEPSSTGKPPDVQPETSSGPPAKVQKTVHHEVTKSGKEYDIICEGDVCRRVPVSKDGAGPSSAPHTPVQQEKPQATVENEDAALTEKMERAKELIEARKREKAAKEKELEKQKELERRNTGQGVAELKKWQADQELKQIQEERKREKMENNLARQRVLEQIAQDRAERRARDLPPQPAPPAEPTQPATAVAGAAVTRARIQFKLPDGTSHTAHFEADGTLGEVQDYVANTLQCSASQFSIWTAFPRRELTAREATLRHLQLTPSSALLILPRSRAQSQVATPGTVASLVSLVSQLLTTYVLEPAQRAYSWLYHTLFPPPPRADPAPAPAAHPLRRRGNVHRLGEEKSEEDDNNTWNGNSTQQM